MTISIIIVSYNVKYFLDQCIQSVYQSEDISELEIIVVDNASTDGSVNFVRNTYPLVQVIDNAENVGFSKANNQGVSIANGEYILILNPDTILNTNTLNMCLAFTKSEPEAGIIGVPMFDGSGIYLPESKRGFPTPFVSFCKIFGLNYLFPKSALVNTYYLGHLDPEKTHVVDVLTGAFMFLRKSVFEEVSGFDEDYFMYGEDIDLSYRVQKTGRKNYYLASSNIIHYKGESTRKLSFDYIKRFYEAMIIFAKKHKSETQVLAYELAIKSAIYLNAFLRSILRFINKISKPFRDGIILYLSFIAIKELWEKYYFNNQDYFSSDVIYKIIPIYVGLGIIVYLFSGKYHKPFKSGKLLKYSGVVLLTLLAIYGLLPIDFRFSRMVLIIGGLMGSAVIFVTDLISHWRYGRVTPAERKTLLVAELEGSNELLALLDRRDRSNLIGFIRPHEDLKKNEVYLGDWEEAESIIRFYGVDEVIFDQQVVSSSQIMSLMTYLGSSCQFKIYTPHTGSVVGSYSREFQGQVDTFDVEYKISTSYLRFIKRFFDMFMGLLFILLSPILWPMNKCTWSYFQYVKDIFIGKKTWVGYIQAPSDDRVLPMIKQSVLAHVSPQTTAGLNETQRLNLDFIYAREYKVWIDFRAVFSQFTSICQ